MKYLTKDTRRKLISYCLRLLPSLGCFCANILMMVLAVKIGHGAINPFFTTNILMVFATGLLVPRREEESLPKWVKILASIAIALGVLLFFIDLLVYYKKFPGLY